MINDKIIKKHKKTQTLDQRPGPTRPEDSDGKYRAWAQAEILNSTGNDLSTTIKGH